MLYGPVMLCRWVYVYVLLIHIVLIWLWWIWKFHDIPYLSKKKRAYDVEPRPWTATVTIVTGHKHSNTHTDTSIFSEHYPKEHFHFTGPLSPLANAGLSSTLLHVSLPSKVISSQLSLIFAPAASAANRKVGGRRAHPCSPSDKDLIVSSFAPVQKPGRANQTSMQTSCCNDGRIVATGTKNFALGWNNHSERISVLAFLNPVHFFLNFPHYLHSRSPTNLLLRAPTHNEVGASCPRLVLQRPAFS